MKYWEYKRDNENDNWRQIIAKFQFEHILRIGPKDDMPESIKSLTRNEFMDLINAKVLSKMKKDENEEKISKTIKHIIALAFCHKFSDPKALNALKSNRDFLLRDMADTTVDVYLTFARNNSKGMSVAKVMAFSEDQAKKTVDDFPPVMDVLDPRYELEAALIENSFYNRLCFEDDRKGNFLAATKAMIFGKDYVFYHKQDIPEDLKKAIRENNYLVLAQYMQMKESGNFPISKNYRSYIEDVNDILDEVNVKPIHNYSNEVYNLNTLSKKKSLTEEEKELLEQARMTIFSNYGDPSPESNAEMSKLLRFKDISEYEMFKSRFKEKLRNQNTGLYCNDSIKGFIKQPEIHNLITYCLKMLKCKESSQMVDDLVTTIPYCVLMKERANFDDSDYEWLIAKKIVASKMRRVNYQDFVYQVKNYHAVFELLQNDPDCGVYSYNEKIRIISQTESFEFILLYLGSRIGFLKQAAELKAIKMMLGDLSLDEFKKYYKLDFETDYYDYFINEYYKEYMEMTNFNRQLTIEELTAFSESSVENVSRIACGIIQESHLNTEGVPENIVEQKGDSTLTRTKGPKKRCKKKKKC